ncbi:MAG: heavy-metal-associated domain-containing protein [Alphaproteobacteria bacterium]|jgi:Cu+-exporting ATPase|nr:heavy-metal-associated domain-containing protein [Alphaproteobacteria bacterium]
MENIILNVGGMHCSSCSALIEETVKELKGVKQAKVDLPNKKASFEFDSKIISVDSIKKAITDLGYTIA